MSFSIQKSGELLAMNDSEGTDEIKRMVMKQSLAEELREQTLSDGVTTLKQDGI